MTRAPAAHPNVLAVDQSDRMVPRNLRQSGTTPVEMLNLDARAKVARVALESCERVLAGYLTAAWFEPQGRRLQGGPRRLLCP